MVRSFDVSSAPRSSGTAWSIEMCTASKRACAGVEAEIELGGCRRPWRLRTRHVLRAHRRHRGHPWARGCRGTCRRASPCRSRPADVDYAQLAALQERLARWRTRARSGRATSPPGPPPWRAADHEALVVRVVQRDLASREQVLDQIAVAQLLVGGPRPSCPDGWRDTSFLNT